MTWLLWLSGPIVATLVAAIWSWVRGRPEPLPDTDEAMRAHATYLQALGQPARVRDHEPSSD